MALQNMFVYKGLSAQQALHTKFLSSKLLLFIRFLWLELPHVDIWTYPIKTLDIIFSTDMFLHLITPKYKRSVFTKPSTLNVGRYLRIWIRTYRQDQDPELWRQMSTVP